MKSNLLNTYCDKNGNVNYKRASKFFGISPDDLCFWHKGYFNLIDTITLMSGVFVGYRPTSDNPMFYASWTMKTCFHSNDDMNYIYRLVMRLGNLPDWATYDFFVMDASGRILFKNFEIDKSVDENGVVRLHSNGHGLQYMIYPAEKRKFNYKHHFCYGKDFKELNKHIVGLTDAKIIKKPKHFKKGFSETKNLEMESQ